MVNEELTNAVGEGAAMWQLCLRGGTTIKALAACANGAGWGTGLVRDGIIDAAERTRLGREGSIDAGWGIRLAREGSIDAG